MSRLTHLPILPSIIVVATLQLGACDGGGDGIDSTAPGGTGTTGGQGVTGNVDTSNAKLGSTPQAVIDNCMDQKDVDMLTAVNQARANAQMCGSTNMPATAPLKWDCQLGNAAIRHSEDMAANGYPNDGHTGWDGSSPFDRMRDAGYQGNAMGENVAHGYRSISSVMQAWMGSPGHCSNIMSPGYNDFGQSEIDFYWTQAFGRS